MFACILFFIYLIASLIIVANTWPHIVWEVVTIVYLGISLAWIGVYQILFFLPALCFVVMLCVLYSERLRIVISRLFFRIAARSAPKLSATEQEALNAGDTWIEQDIFRAEIDWTKTSKVHTTLTKEEQAFLDEETQTLCDRLDEWSISLHRDLPESVWQYIRDKGFLGLVIAKEYGGKGFSARAHSDIVMKISSHSGVAAVTVMVPNSLGPGELIYYYGTEAQKKYYLPRLAQGIDIPCFALTEPGAGSDATAIDSEAIVVQKKIDGKQVLGLELTVNKRWITLAPVATLIGLAVNLRDPDGLLNGVGCEGITCVLIHRDTPHLEIGNRHLPADQPFMNGTIRAHHAFVEIDNIIGGQQKAGKGWQMLVECLSIGRSISLPALATGSSAVAYLTTGAFSRIRRQFTVDICEFEGVQEKLAEIAGLSYIIQSTRLLTLRAVYEHKKPSVASAITKYFNTELGRIVLNHAMDVHGGRAVVVGERNYLSNHYMGIPISITVEGANIMTRNLLIFGQGSIACHPFVKEEFYALQRNDQGAFHSLIWQHVHYTITRFSKAILSAWTGGILIHHVAQTSRRSLQKFMRLTFAFSFLADFSLIVLGGNLKRKERLSARLADALSHLYMFFAVYSYYQQEVNKHSKDSEKYRQTQETHRIHADWAMQYNLYHAQHALMAFCDNFSYRWLGKCLRFVLFPFGQTMRYPADRLDAKLAQLMSTNNPYRDFLKESVYIHGDHKKPVDRVENAFQYIIEHESLYSKVRDLKRYQFAHLKQMLAEKVAQAVITEQEMEQIVEMERLRWDAIQVDEFDFKAMQQSVFHSLTDTFKNPLDI